MRILVVAAVLLVGCSASHGTGAGTTTTSPFVRTGVDYSSIARKSLRFCSGPIAPIILDVPKGYHLTPDSVGGGKCLTPDTTR